MGRPAAVFFLMILGQNEARRSAAAFCVSTLEAAAQFYPARAPAF